MHRCEVEQGQGARVLEPGATQATHPGGLYASIAEERCIAMSPVIGLTRGGGDGQARLTGSRLALDGRALSGVAGAAPGVDAGLLRPGEAGNGGTGHPLIPPDPATP